MFSYNKIKRNELDSFWDVVVKKLHWLLMDFYLLKEATMHELESLLT